MTTIIIILSIIAAIILGIARIYKNKNAPAVEQEKTERVEARLDFRTKRRESWQSRWNKQSDKWRARRRK